MTPGGSLTGWQHRAQICCVEGNRNKVSSGAGGVASGGHARHQLAISVWEGIKNEEPRVSVNGFVIAKPVYHETRVEAIEVAAELASVVTSMRCRVAKSGLRVDPIDHSAAHEEWHAEQRVRSLGIAWLEAH